ncbi:FHA domain-containing protein [Planctomycetota bacterium]|nr:FHA domain-containing protein [Planctomycetota bacterium]
MLRDYLDRVIAGTSEDQFLADYPHAVLVEIESDEDAHEESSGAATRMLRGDGLKRQAAGSHTAHVYVLEGSKAQNPLWIGRATESTIRLEHGSISKLHARLAFTDDGWELEDPGSTNGTFVDGRRLQPGVTHRLLGDERLVVGRSTCLQFFESRPFFQYLHLLQRFGL